MPPPAPSPTTVPLPVSPSALPTPQAKAEEAKAEYVAAGGGAKPRAKKEKAAKDGDAPKRSNPYMNFSKAKRAEVQAANPGMKITEISKVLGQEWSKLSDEEKAE